MKFSTAPSSSKRSPQTRLLAGLLFCLLTGLLASPPGAARQAAAAPPAQAVPAALAVDFWEGQPLPPALLGQTLDTYNSAVYESGANPQLSVAVARSLRGPAAGLYGEFFSWIDPLGLDDPRRRLDPAAGEPPPGYAGCPSPPPPAVNESANLLGTLDFLRLNSDRQAAPLFVVNARGLANWFAWPDPQQNPYITTDLAELQALAGDWVFYTQYVLRRFDQSRPPSESSSDPLERRAARLLARLRWQNCGGSNPRALLPAPGESALPAALDWEIGNEPNYPLAGFSLSPQEYARRYQALAARIVAEDRSLHGGNRSLRLGPVLMAPDAGDDQKFAPYMQALLAQFPDPAQRPIDFISYHPYTILYGYWSYAAQTGEWFTVRRDAAGELARLPDDAAAWEADPQVGQEFLRRRLSGLYGQHAAWAETIRAYGAPRLVASEWNPSSWQSTFFLKWRAKSMAQALGVLETVFSFARLGVEQAHYYIYPSVNGDTQQPVYQTFEFLQAHLGDRLLGWAGGDQDNWRAYITRDSQTGELLLWGLNWGATPQTIDFQVQNLPTCLVYRNDGSLYELAAPSLLHGALDEPGAPPLPAALSVQTRPAPSGDFLGQAQVALELQPNSWAAYPLQQAGYQRQCLLGLYEARLP